jgi:hypothetical protein
MENTNFFDDDAIEQERVRRRMRYLLALSLKLAETSLVLGGLVGLLLFLTTFLGWSRIILPYLLGLLAGMSLAAAVVTSLQSKAVITMFLGGLLLPGLAVYVSYLAGNDPRAFDAANSVLMPFVAYTAASFIGGLIIARIWQNMPVRTRQEKAEKEPGPVLTQGKKEQMSHEGSHVDKAA